MDSEDDGEEGDAGEGEVTSFDAGGNKDSMAASETVGEMLLHT